MGDGCLKKCKIIELNKHNFFNSIKENYAFIILSVCLILGIVIGIIFCSESTNIFNAAKYIFKNGFLLYSKSTFLNCFLKVLFVCSVILAVLFAFGSSIFGIVIIPILLNLFGIVYGGIYSYVYGAYSLKGLAFNAIILLPTTVFIIIIIILAAKEAFCLSLSVVNLTVKNTLTNNLFFSFKTFCFKNLIFILLLSLSSLLNNVITSAFLDLFNFNV